MSIMKDCMVVNIHVGTWSGHKKDKEKTRKVTEDAGAHDGAIAVNKHLVAKDPLSGIVTSYGKIRTFFYAKTLPWKDNGDRLISRTAAQDFLVEFATLESEFKAEVDDFIVNKWPQVVAQAEFRMGDSFNPADYPPGESLRNKFYVSIDIDAVAAGKDIRLNDSTEILQARVTKAMAGLWEKLAKPLSHFAETMSDEKKIFRDSTVDNLRSIVEMIPALNFTGDPDLDKIRTEIEQRIIGWDAADLRKNKEARAAVAGQAKQIMDDMAPFMNAFSNGAAA